MEKEKIHSGGRTIKVRDLIQALKANELILNLASVGSNDPARFVKELTTILRPYRDLDGEEFLLLLADSLRTHVPLKIKNELTASDDIKVKSLSFEEIRKMISSGCLTTKSLLSIAEKNLGIPIGTLKKANKKVIEQRILGSIGSIEKLNTIGKKAAE